MFFNLLTVGNLLYICQACESFEDRIDVIDLRGKRGLLLGDKYYKISLLNHCLCIFERGPWVVLYLGELT